jgi:hypothetical protein
MIAFLAGICLMSLALVIRSQNQGNFAVPQASSSRSTGLPETFNRFKLTPSSGYLRAGDIFNLQLSGEALDDGSVLGFDALIEIKGIDYEVVSVKSKNFDIVKIVKARDLSHLTITGIKSLGAPDALKLSQGPLADMVMKVKSSGTMTSRVIATSGRETSKIIFDGPDGLNKVTATSD